MGVEARRQRSAIAPAVSGGPRGTVLSRVLASYILITLLFTLVAGYSVLGQRRSVSETELMRSGYTPLMLSLRDAVAGQNTYNSQLNHITEARNPADKRVWFDTTLGLGRPKMFGQIRAALERAFAGQDNVLGRELTRETNRIEAFVADDKETLSQLFAALEQGEQLRAQELRDALVTRGSQASGLLQNLEGRVSLHVDALIDEASKRERWTLRVLLMWALFTLVLGVGVTLYARGLLRPLVAVTERAQAVAQGDLTPQPVTAKDDEIGHLANTFEGMVEAIGRARRELLESERLATIGKMAAHVTHEVRNPLSSIALNLELLEEELDNGEAQTLHQAIKREVERLTELTEQYLSVARRDEPRLEPEDLGEVVGEAASFLRVDLKRHNVEVVTEIEPAIPEVLLDAAQIRQVLHNLVRNARQAMPDGGVVKLRLRSAEGGVELSVIDTGTGVSSEVREHLFEPFLTTKNHGTGLGLAISRHIVERHQGKIRCEANTPKGTVFVVTIPLVRS